MMDEVMVSIMRKPKTFTREDIVEINCHGGIVVVNQILQLVLRQGARLAEPGEFTKRAFLNGRVDLSQAEAVMDLIRAKTDKAMNLAINQLDGNLSRLIRQLRQEILETLAQVEVNIDYPEYDDVEELTTRFIIRKGKSSPETDTSSFTDSTARKNFTRRSQYSNYWSAKRRQVKSAKSLITGRESNCNRYCRYY